MTVTAKVIETKKVKVQASPIPEKDLTPLKIYDAICEVTEYTTQYVPFYGGHTETSTANNYVVINDAGEERRYGQEFFRQV